ncbi:MAG TPA: tRNA 2-selenouridine(34) synthase MnmH [Edaphocola sp.]|nr:tRNA 2-selenouridine(34) synthase MnmH [Edaphocola sp.]
MPDRSGSLYKCPTFVLVGLVNIVVQFQPCWFYIIVLVQKISVTEFLALQAEARPVIDVRSPAEHELAHIPGAVNLPLFSNAERAEIGTAYKQINRREAVQIGLGYFKDKMQKMLQEVAGSFPEAGCKKILVHCWRGGMRSEAVAWLLSLYGYEVSVLAGGYKAYRNWVLQQFKNDYRCALLGGFTGSGKTEILHKMKADDYIDLEAIANHRGSVFGAYGSCQPGQQMFENLLAAELYKRRARFFWIEDESRRIGDLNLPEDFWALTRRQPVYFLDVPFEQRLAGILKDYGHKDSRQLAEGIERLGKRLGGMRTHRALAYLSANDLPSCFAILLKYYDKLYGASMQGREKRIHVIKGDGLAPYDIIGILEHNGKDRFNGIF